MTKTRLLIQQAQNAFDQARKASELSDTANTTAKKEKDFAKQSKSKLGMAQNETTAEDVEADADTKKSDVLKIFARDKVDQVVVNYNSVLNNT